MKGGDFVAAKPKFTLLGASVQLNALACHCECLSDLLEIIEQYQQTGPRLSVEFGFLADDLKKVQEDVDGVREYLIEQEMD